MTKFSDFIKQKTLLNAIDDLGFHTPTPIQEQAFSVIRSGRNIVGISQTGTGKTLAYMLPLLHDLKYSKQLTPRILILVPTRELVLQAVEQIETYSKYISTRVLGVYGGTNINTQKKAVAKGVDILVATPGRLYDLAMTGVLRLKSVAKLIIDEVDVMLDLGFRYQLTNIFDLLPNRRQNIMFSATMTQEVDELIKTYFIAPKVITIAVSGTPLENIAQNSYEVKNFYTKVNLLKYIVKDKKTFQKVLIFVSEKKNADRLFAKMEEEFGTETGIIHSNKSQNFRIRSVQDFDSGKNRLLIATDVMARGLDIDNVSHVINFDTPKFPENYMHRIGRTGRAERKGQTILFYTEKEKPDREAIENLMDYKIPQLEFPNEVEVTSELTPEERPKMRNIHLQKHKKGDFEKGAAFHEKKAKNLKTNKGNSYKKRLKKKYKKPKTKGDKVFNRKNKRK